MADGSNTAPVPLDLAGVTKLIADAIKPMADALKTVGDNQKVISDTMIADAKAKADAETAAKTAATTAAEATKKPGDAAKPLTAEDVAKLVSDGLTNTLKARDEAAKSSAEREKFMGEKLKDIPAAYRGQLGNDPAKWAAEEQQIRQTVKTDLAAMGATVKDVGGGNAAGGAGVGGGAAVNAHLANLTPGQAAFAQGIKLPA